jgi:hypothetical protein
MVEIINQLISWLFFLFAVGIIIFGMVLRIRDTQNKISNHNLPTIKRVIHKFVIFLLIVWSIVAASVVILFIFRAFTE